MAEVREGQSPPEVGQRAPDAAALPTSSMPGTAPPTLPDRPSIAALPFVNLSGDPEQVYFADGVVEDIITALSRIRWLLVIGRNSSFTYKDRVVDVKQVGRELGVRYVLEGSVSADPDHIQVNVRLIDAQTDEHLWAERFDKERRDLRQVRE